MSNSTRLTFQICRTCHTEFDIVLIKMSPHKGRIKANGWRWKENRPNHRRRLLSCASPRFDRSPTIRPATYRFRFIVIRRLGRRAHSIRPFWLRLRLFKRALPAAKVFQYILPICYSAFVSS